MPLEIKRKFSNNWRIGQETVNRLQTQEGTGWYDEQNRVYLGDTKHLSKLTDMLSEACEPIDETENRKIFVRKSCINQPTDDWTPPGKYQPLEIYLSQGQGKERTVHEATWTPPRKWSDQKIKTELESRLQKSGLSENKPRYTEGFKD